MNSKIKITTGWYESKGLKNGDVVEAYLTLDDGDNSNYNWVAFLTYNKVPFVLDEYVDFIKLKDIQD